MVSEKLIVVLLVVAIVMSVISVAITASLNIRTPVNILGKPKTEDSAGAQIKLIIEPVLALVGSGQ